MKRGKKMVAVAHCILNANAKVMGLSSYASMVKPLVAYLMEKDIGIIQLPCPEMHAYGANRWGHVKEQFDTPFYRESCRSMLTSFVWQIKDYSSKGYQILGIIGIDGSPSCGVEKTCSSLLWNGDFLDKDETWKKVEDLRYVNEKGVFIEVLEELLLEYGLSIPFMALEEGDPQGSMEKLKELIK